MAFIKLYIYNNQTPSFLAIRRFLHNKSRIGHRDIVGYGINGSYNYFDQAAHPFPAIRFKENSKHVISLREKERGDWNCLTLEEKKCLYRASFCQTFAEFQAPTGQWKMILGATLMGVSFGFWMITYYNYFVYDPLPPSFCLDAQQAQLRRMLDLLVNPVDGISSKWDYDKDRWKFNITF